MTCRSKLVARCFNLLPFANADEAALMAVSLDVNLYQHFQKIAGTKELSDQVAQLTLALVMGKDRAISMGHTYVRSIVSLDSFYVHF